MKHVPDYNKKIVDTDIYLTIKGGDYFLGCLIQMI